MLSKFMDVFEKPGQPPAACVYYRIDLIDNTNQSPHRCCYYISQPELDELKKQIDSILEKGWIALSTSPYGHPMLFACRKRIVVCRLYVDFMMVKCQHQVKTDTPCHAQMSFLTTLMGTVSLAVLACNAGITRSAQPQSTSIRQHLHAKYGLFEFKTMPFELTICTLSAFQRFMHMMH